MVDMLEGVEDICASLGLGHIPLLNEENRELNRKLQELQIQLRRNKQKISEEAKQQEIYQEHIKTVREAKKLNQELCTAKKEEIAAEENLLKVQEVLQERLLKDKRNGEKKIQELDEVAEKLNEEIEELEETIKNTERIIDEEEDNKTEWTKAMNLIEEDLAKLSRYFQADEVKVKDLTLKLTKLREKVKISREELKAASTRSKMAQLALDKSAEEFREAHKERQEVVRQWESSVELLSKRDAEIEVASSEVERIKNIVEKRNIDLQEQMNFYNNELGNIEELKKKTKASEKKAQTLKEKLTVSEEEKKAFENEVTLERRQILKISCDIDQNRSRLNKLKKDKSNNTKKLESLNQQIITLGEKKAVSNSLVLSAEEKAQEIENILMVYEKQRDQMRSVLEKQKNKTLILEKQLRDSQNDKDIADLEVKSIMKEQTKLKTRIKEIQEQLQKKEDILYHSEFELAKLDRQNAKMTGKSPDENRTHLKEELALVKSKLEEQNSAKRSLDNLIYKLEVSIKKSRKEIQQIHDLNNKKEEEINETELVIETSTRHASALKHEIQELTVEDKMLSMAEIKIKDEIKLIQKEVLEIEKIVVEEEGEGREKVTGCRSVREMYEGQVRCIQSEIDDLHHQIQLRESRTEKMKVKHDTIFKSLGKMEDENGEQIPSHAYYLVKLAQEKAELKDQSDMLGKKIKREEADLKEMRKALEILKSSNSDFRTVNMRKKNTEDAEVTQLKKEEEENRKELRRLKKELASTEKEAEIQESNIYHFKVEIESLKSIQEEKEETLRSMTRAVLEEERKLERAQNNVEKSKLEIRETAPRSASEYETDMNIRLQRDKQRTAVNKLLELSQQDLAVREMATFLLEKLNIAQSDPTSRQPTPASRTRTPASAGRKKVAGKKKMEERKEVAEPSPGDTEPRWQVAVDKPRFI